MAAPYLIEDIHGRVDRAAVLRMSNASVQETSLLTLDRESWPERQNGSAPGD